MLRLAHRDDRHCTTVDYTGRANVAAAECCDGGITTSLVDALYSRNSSHLPPTGVEIRGKLNTTHSPAIYCRRLRENTVESTDVCEGSMIEQTVSCNGRGVPSACNGWGCIFKPDPTTARIRIRASVASFTLSRGSFDPVGSLLHSSSSRL